MEELKTKQIKLVDKRLEVINGQEVIVKVYDWVNEKGERVGPVSPLERLEAIYSTGEDETCPF